MRHKPETFKEYVAKYEATCFIADTQQWVRKPSIPDFVMLNGYVDKAEIMSMLKLPEYKIYVRRLLNLIDAYHENKVSPDLYLKSQSGWQETTNTNIKMEAPEKIKIDWADKPVSPEVAAEINELTKPKE